jgi:LSD1 subclass zinc finger protein
MYSPCYQCGGRLKYVPGTRHLRCPYCHADNHFEDAVDAPDPLQEQDYLRAAFKERTEHSPVVPEWQVNCLSCGASNAVHHTVAATHCSFCDAPLANFQAF